MTPEKLEIRLGDVRLEDSMPLHFYGIKDGSKLDVLKPFVNTTIQNNQGATLYWRLERKDTIKDVKAELVAAQSSFRMRLYFYGPILGQPGGLMRSNTPMATEIRGLSLGNPVQGT